MSSAAARDRVVALNVLKAPIPHLAVPFYRTRGSLVRVSLPGNRLDAVNAELQAVIQEDQVRYAKLAIIRERTMGRAFARAHPGVYEIHPVRSLISANTRVVSALFPVLRLFPGGNDGEGWIALTVSAPAGERLRLVDIIRRGPAALEKVARMATNELLTSNRCVRNGIAAHDIGAGFATRLRWSPDNYRIFALTPSGLAFGFEVNRVAGPICGRVKVILRYRELAPYLSPLGAKLVSAIQ